MIKQNTCNRQISPVFNLAKHVDYKSHQFNEINGFSLQKDSTTDRITPTPRLRFLFIISGYWCYNMYTLFCITKLENLNILKSLKLDWNLETHAQRSRYRFLRLSWYVYTILAIVVCLICLQRNLQSIVKPTSLLSQRHRKTKVVKIKLLFSKYILFSFAVFYCFCHSWFQSHSCVWL